MLLLVAYDSPLRVRVDIDPRQASSLDAVAFCANVIDVLYRRLATALLAGSRKGALTAEETLPDAWALIDWVHIGLMGSFAGAAAFRIRSARRVYGTT